MKKIVLSGCLLMSLAQASQGECPDAVARSAQYFNTVGGFFKYPFYAEDGKEITLRSFFDIEKFPGLEELFGPCADNQRDLRPFEMWLCRMAQASQSWYIAHRGKLGVVIGALVTTLYSRFFNKQVPTKSVHKSL